MQSYDEKVDVAVHAAFEALGLTAEDIPSEVQF